MVLVQLSIRPDSFICGVQVCLSERLTTFQELL